MLGNRGAIKRDQRAQKWGTARVMQPDRTQKGVNSIRSDIISEGATMPVVILKVRKGWTTEQKRKIVKEFTNTLVSTLKIDPDLVTIMIDEHSLEDIGHGGVLRCDEH